MEIEYIDIDLTCEQKDTILKYADLFLFDQITKSDLLNKRKKWIRFNKRGLSDVIGELSHHHNRCKSNYLCHLLDELICQLEFYEGQAK
jgi:hypothetical protein